MRGLVLAGLLAMLCPVTASGQTMWTYTDRLQTFDLGGGIATAVVDGWCVADGYQPLCGPSVRFYGYAAYNWGAYSEVTRIARPDVCLAMHAQNRSCNDESLQWCGNEDVQIEAGWRTDCVGIRAGFVTAGNGWQYFFTTTNGIGGGPTYGVSFYAARFDPYELYWGVNEQDLTIH
jgi:hypothetical protein